MSIRKGSIRILKEACRQEKRKYVTGWKVGAIVLLIFALLFTPLSMAVKVFDNALVASLGGRFWELENEDSSAIFFATDFATQQELQEQTNALEKQIAMDGAVLLKNENGVLPLQAEAQISCFADAAMVEALEKAGFKVEIPTTDENFVQKLEDIVVVSLSGGEEDTELLDSLSRKRADGKIKTLIALFTTIDALKMDISAVDGVLWIGKLGQYGNEAVAEILGGKANPSGKLPVSVGSLAEDSGSIYAGYKYYETRYEDFVMGTGNAGDYDYHALVQYPFGYGLSYTEFSCADMEVFYNEKTDRFEVTVTVTNIGAVAGRETIQVYAQSPYTDYDRENRVEKASVNLVGFAKTNSLEPNQSQKLTAYVNKRDLASFDTNGAGTYILEAGNYYLTVATDAHSAVNNILTAKGYTDVGGNTAQVYQWRQEQLDDKTYGVSANGAAISSQLTSQQTASSISRQDWQATDSVKTTPAEEQQGDYRPEDYPAVTMPTLGAQNGLKLYELIGAAMDDPKWQTLLDQLTFEDMVSMIGDAYGGRMPALSVQAPGVCGKDLAVMDSSLLGATFDTELIYRLGRSVGNHALTNGVSNLYDFNGLCYSEDGYLSGKIGASQVLGIQDKGVDVAIRPFTLVQDLQCDEQTARERYLRAGQITITEGKAGGILLGDTSLNGNAKALIMELIRKEWGNQGFVVSDDETQSAPEGVLYGITEFHSVMPNGVKELEQYREDPVIVSAMRQACHYNLYALVNSSAMNGIGQNTTVTMATIPLVVLCRAVAAISWLLFVVFVVFWGIGKRKWKKSEAYLDYKTMKRTLKEERKYKR